MNENNTLIDSRARKEIIKILKNVIYFWIDEGNGNTSLYIYRLITENLHLTIPQKNKMDEIKKTWDNCFKGQVDEKMIQPTEIPKQFNKDEDDRLIYVSTQIVVNLFNADFFQWGYSTLMDLYQYSDEIYILTIPLLKKLEHYSELKSWLLFHALVATDISGELKMEEQGYQVIIEKPTEEDSSDN